jgi:ParB-like chromosome segregation protein Spo0J
MNIETWPIDRPIPYARNARKITPAAVNKLAASLKEFGWQQAIVVDLKDVIVVGHTRLQAARKLGLTEVPVHVAGDLTPAQIKAYRIMDNRSAQETSWDFDLLGPELLELGALDIDLKLTGFEKPQLMKLLAAEMFGDKEEEAAGAAEFTPSMEYRVVVDCADESQQTELLDRFEREGLKCRVLIS